MRKGSCSTFIAVSVASKGNARVATMIAKVAGTSTVVATIVVSTSVAASAARARHIAIDGRRRVSRRRTMAPFATAFNIVQRRRDIHPCGQTYQFSKVQFVLRRWYAWMQDRVRVCKNVPPQPPPTSRVFAGDIPARRTNRGQSWGVRQEGAVSKYFSSYVTATRDLFRN